MELVTLILSGIWETLLEMAPFLLFGFLMAGILSVVVSPTTVERHLGTGRVRPVVKAALFGVPLPLCSCSVIPVAASLRQHGANRAATTSFLISTPQTGVDSIFVTYSLLGLVFAIFRPVAAFISGVVGGLVVSGMDKSDDDGATPEEKPACCCHAEHKTNKFIHGLRHGFVVLPRDIAGPLLIGLFIAGLIGALVPEDYFGNGLGGGLAAKFVMMGLSIPVYVCATATVPVAAALIAAGLSPGAALVFLMAGPATNAATITTVWSTMGKRTALLYVAVVGVSAIVAGIVLDLVYTQTGVLPEPSAHHMLPEATRVALAVLLLVVLGAAKLPRMRSAA